MASGWNETCVAMPGMDCPAEEQAVRLAVAQSADVVHLDSDLIGRQLTVVHRGSADSLLAFFEPLELGAHIVATRPAPPPELAGCAAGVTAQRRALAIVLAINATMFVTELVVGLWARSAGVVADSLDMLADATVYGMALAAVGSAHAAQARTARTIGWIQLALAGAILAEVARRTIAGGEPVSAAMAAMGVLALVANVTCVAVLAGHRRGGLHLRASWIFTTCDAVANLGVILAAGLVALTGSRIPDLVAGLGVALLVGSGARRILRISGATRN